MAGETKNEMPADSPTSVLEDEDICTEEIEVKSVGNRKIDTLPESNENVRVKLKEEVVMEAVNGDSLLISEAMLEEEEKVLEARVKEEMKSVSEEAPNLNESQFEKLDALLSQTQLYSKFLLEKIDDITHNEADEDTKIIKVEEETVKQGTKRGRKRKDVTYNNKKAKRAVEAMLTRTQEDEKLDDENLTEEERSEKEQRELVPALTGGKLKSYQLKGIKWLISLWQNGLNGILADQMGLGKTIQTIGFLAHLKGKGLDGPYLVMAPLSTLSNWINEFSRFTPSLKTIIYHGDKRQRAEIRRKHMPKKIGPNFPIVVTSYEIALFDAKTCLKHYNWKYVVVDEGHRLKNSECKLFKTMKFVPMENKLLLTGTPLQNNLAELWSLLNFILPDIFSSHLEFESWFDLSGKSSSEDVKEELEEKRRAHVVAKLHAILRPFILRRLKSDVELSLPRKKEIILYATMTEHQKNFQEHLINKTLDKHLIKNAGDGWRPHGCKTSLNNLMIQLRKNCNHPDLLESPFSNSWVYPPVDQVVGQCGKFRLLERLLTHLHSKNHKVLIFSQWTKILNIMDYYFSEKGFNVCRIDGNVKLEERRKQIDIFNDVNSDRRIFLLSTRAGGLGINLTAADTCILYDSDWNPQMDLQAMDRCHRIGQTKPVHVYRLTTAQSVEGRMLKRAFSKLRLEHVVIGKGHFQLEKRGADVLEEEELIALLRDEEDGEDKLFQTDINDEDLIRVMDRSDLITTSPPTETTTDMYPLKGPGWEVVIPSASGGMLSSLNS